MFSSTCKYLKQSLTSVELRWVYIGAPRQNYSYLQDLSSSWKPPKTNKRHQQIKNVAITVTAAAVSNTAIHCGSELHKRGGGEFSQCGIATRIVQSRLRVHQGSLISPLDIYIVIRALTQTFPRCHWLQQFRASYFMLRPSGATWFMFNHSSARSD